MTKEAWAAYMRQYRVTHLAASRAGDHRNYVKHKEKRTAWQKVYVAEHKEQTVEYKRVWRLEHLDEIHAGQHEWYLTHKEEHCARMVRYAENHPEAGRLHTEKRRALKYSNTPIDELLTEAQWRDILDQYHHRCAYCGSKLDKLTIDHVVPLIKGGKHSASNVVPACLHCNSSKKDKTPEQWVGMAVAK